MIKDFFSNLFLAYRAEHIKLKGTAFYIVSAIFGAAVPILYFIVMAFVTNPAQGDQAPINYYVKAFHEVLIPYANFFFPLLIVIAVSRITQFDHKNGGWQLMETQPLQKTSIYLSKYLVVLTACLFSIVVLMCASYLFSWVLSFIKEIPKSASTGFEGLEFFKLFTRLLVASLFLIAFQYFISVLIPSFIWSILIGFAGILGFLFLSGLNIAPDWYPNEIISRVPRYSDGSEIGYWFTYTETLSVLFTIVVLYLGFQWYSHKRLILVLRSKHVLLSSISVIIVCGALITYLLIPNTLKFHNRTTLAGKIESDVKLNTVYVKGLVDTLAIIPVQENAFKVSIPGKMPFGKYTLFFDRAFQLTVFMGEKDSTFLEVEYYFNQPQVKIKGTRLVENQSVGNSSNFVSYVPFWIENNVYMDRPDRVADRLYKEWEDEMKRGEKFKTVDNYVSKEDFIGKFKKLTTLQLLTYWNAYQKKRAFLYDTIDSKIPDKIQEMKASVNLRDETMLVETEYLQYVRDELVANNTEDVDLQTKYLHEVSKLEKGSFKDNLLYWVLSEGIFDAQNEQEISTLVSYTNQFENPKYAPIVEANASLRSGLTRGKAAPYFEASTPGNKTIGLKDLEGKLTVVDVWATWCVPCREQAPYFEKFALKYKGEKIQFVSLSTDRKHDSWLMETKNMSGPVIQLHANDLESFVQQYDVQSIPRFILIDAAGKILNASLPAPSESGFEIILRKELGLGDE